MPNAVGPRPEAVQRVEQTCRRCLLPVGVDGGGVALVTGRGHRATVCATDDVASRIEDIQFLLGEGPCIDASSTRSPVLVADLTDPREGVQVRWPGFLPDAAEWGVRAVFAFPLRLGAIALGAMDLYRREPGPLSAGQLRAALLAADAAALALLDVAAPADIGGDGAQPVDFRLAVHAAAGMVQVQLRTTIEMALVHLRAAAYVEGRSINDVAAEVVEGRRRFDGDDA